MEKFIDEIYPIYLEIQKNPKKFEKDLNYRYDITNIELTTIINETLSKKKVEDGKE